MNKPNTLSPHQYSALVHHVELHKSGWWDKTLKGLVFATVWLADEDIDIVGIIHELQHQWDVRINHEAVEIIARALVGEESLLKTPKDTYLITQSARKKFEAEIEETEASEKDAREYFMSLIAESNIDVDTLKTWEAFDRDVLTPMVRDIGSNTYKLIAGEQVNVTNKHVEKFFNNFPKQQKGALREVTSKFFDPKQTKSRDYVIRLLHASFCIEAKGVSQDVLEILNDVTNKQPEFRLFVDTNFLFSLLGIHENPSNSATDELKEIFSTIESPKISLRITPRTIEEAKGVISAAKDRVSRIPMSANFSAAVMRIGMSGIIERYFSEKQSRGGKLTPGKWFDQYLDDFILMARKAGVDIFNENLEAYGTRQDVVDDIINIMQYEKKHLPEGRQKSYEKVAHDVILWHVVKDKRVAYVESPFDAKEWVLTVDFRLINFDKHKCKTGDSQMPLCLHPISLIQLLQFWVPRTEKFEQAVLGGLRLPFLFQDFDAKSERVSFSILEEAGKFTGSEKFSEELLTKLLVNQSLRARIGVGRSSVNVSQSVHDTLIAELQQQAELEKLNSDKVKSTLKSAERDVDNLKEQKATDSESIKKLRKKISEKDKLLLVEKEKSLRLEQIFYLLGYVVFLVSATALSIVVALHIDFAFTSLNTLQNIAIKIATGAFVFLILHIVFEQTVGKTRQLGQLRPLKWAKKFRAGLYSAAVFFAASIVANWVSSLLF